MLEVNVSDRAYFKTLKSGNGSTPIQIEIVRGRISVGWATIVAHRLIGPKGEFAAVITRLIVPATLQSALPSWCSGRERRFSMYRRDGVLLARYPHIEHMIGSNIRSSNVYAYLSQSNGSTLHLTSPIDGQERLASSTPFTISRFHSSQA